MNEIFNKVEKYNAQQKYCCNWGLTEEQSAAVHIQALVSADGILPVISSIHHLLFVNLASVPGRQLVNSPTAAILERRSYGDFYPRFSGYMSRRYTTLDLVDDLG